MKVCACHGQEMYWNPDSRYRKGGFWACRVKHRESARRRYLESAEVRRDRQKRNVRRVRAGETYLGTAQTEEAAFAINLHVRRQLTDFKNKQREERDGWRNRQAVA